MSERYLERRTEDGSWTLAHGAHGETFHSVSGAWTQARERYAGACRVRERARELHAGGTRVLRLLDVGTGLGLNLAAALEALDGTGVVLEATSLERDADLLAVVARAPREPAELERWHAPVRAALSEALAAPGEALSAPGAAVALAGGALDLRLGDARETLAALPAGARFDAVFLDPFSPRVEPELWAPGFLAAVARRLAPGGVLSTYSAATAVRAGLLAAGLRVGLGPRVGAKREGTTASPDVELEPLEPRVRRRIEARASAIRDAAGFAALAGDPSGAIP